MRRLKLLKFILDYAQKGFISLSLDQIEAVKKELTELIVKSL